jgi:XRE family transcriptional regulator, regulator of sulfur utilization
MNQRQRAAGEKGRTKQKARRSAQRGAAAQADPHLGEAIRRFREEQSLSVRTLAGKCGFSASFISQVELGQASPSIASLDRIASGLGITLGQFFKSGEASEPVLVKAEKRLVLRSEWSRAQIESLAPSAGGGRLEALFISLRPGGSSGTRLHANATEIFALVFAGSVQLQLQDATHKLGRGDAITLPPGTPHRWANTTAKSVQLLKVVAC